MTIIESLCLVGFVVAGCLICVLCIIGEYQANIEKNKSEFLLDK